MSNRCVMIVEDSSTMRQLICFALRRMGNLDFVEAENGAVAFEILKKQRIDIILLDLNMPVMSGFGFLERFAAMEGQKPPVIVITTEGGKDDVDRAISLGASAYVTKPVQAASLAETVERVLAAK